MKQKRKLLQSATFWAQQPLVHAGKQLLTTHVNGDPLDPVVSQNLLEPGLLPYLFWQCESVVHSCSVMEDALPPSSEDLQFV